MATSKILISIKLASCRSNNAVYLDDHSFSQTNKVTKIQWIFLFQKTTQMFLMGKFEMQSKNAGQI